jgi:hypothetical protein
MIGAPLPLRASDAFYPTPRSSRYYAESHEQVKATFTCGASMPNGQSSISRNNNMNTEDRLSMRVRAPNGGQSAHTDHNEHAYHSVEMFRQKFWGTLLLSSPTLVWTPMMQHWFGYTPLAGPTRRDGSPRFSDRWSSAYGGWVPLERPWRFSSVRHQHASRIATAGSR